MNKLLTLRKVNCLYTVETIELGCFSKEEFTTELHREEKNYYAL